MRFGSGLNLRHFLAVFLVRARGYRTAYLHFAGD
jgi:hypothetical protein